MKKITLYIVAIAIIASPATATAQNTNTAYFIDGYSYRHEMNPAFDNEQAYIAMPILGNINVSLMGNLDLQDVIYNVNGRTTTFLNEGVSTGEFLSNIDDKNKLTTDVKIGILSAGFKAWGGYNTVGINLRTNIGVTVPGSLFRLAKEGPANTTYDISDFNAHADAYVELALGHSRKLDDKLRVGAKLKFLIGLANIDADFDKAQLTLGENGFTAVTNATVQTSIKGFTYQTEDKMRGAEGEQTKHTYVNDVDVDGTGVNGFGLAIDLGAEYKLNDDWSFSAAVLDLGFISWSNNVVASTNGDRTFDTDTYIFNVDDEKSNSFDNELDRLVEGVSTLYELQDNGDQGGRTKMLGVTINLGAEYTLPYYRKLTFGALSTTRLQGNYSWTDLRISANVAPVSIFSAGISGSIGTYGASFGWIANLHMTGLNIFVGMDRTLGSVSKQFVPLTSNASVNFGLNFLF